MPSSEPRVHAPELPAGLPWLNAGAPIALRALRGHVVVLDFWTYCCVNCMHVAPVLARLEEALADEPFAVIGVHSGKFDAEQDAARVAEAVRRLRVTHPVVVDRDMQVWSAFAVRSWPTLVVIRPDGTIAAIAPGEPDEASLLGLVRDELARARAKGTLAKARLDVARAAAAPMAPLAYPGKVAIAPDGGIAIADSGQGRVVLVDPGGGVRAVVEGLDEPQGLAFRGADELFVADARAHVVWRLDLARGARAIVAGTSTLGDAPLGFEPRPARAVALRSPWDLALAGDLLYVALAGSHQIGVVDLARGTVAALAGTGAESMQDGPLREATFAQPSGLARAGDLLYLADSETSAVRVVDLGRAEVRTLVGHGLFDFGDRDGDARDARLQHCVGIALAPDGAPVVADTYNGKLRRVDPATGSVTTVAAGLAEPGGLAWDTAHGAWLVADTNAHRVVHAAGDALAELALRDVPPAAPTRAARSGPKEPAVDVDWFTTALAPEGDAALAPGAATVTFEIAAPQGKKIAPGSPLAATLEVSRRSDLLVPKTLELRGTASDGARGALTFEVAVGVLPADHVDAEVVARVDYVACDADAGEGAVCVPRRAWLRLPVALAKHGARAIRLRAAS